MSDKLKFCPQLTPHFSEVLQGKKSKNARA